MASSKGQAILTTIGASSIEQKLAQMRETVARLTKKAEEQNLQVTALANTEGRSLSTSATNGASIGATITPQHATTKFVPSREQGEHHKREPVINLTSLGAPKHAAEGKPRMLVAQVMTIGVISVEEQLAQMKETIARLTKTAEEKDLQITALTNKLGARYEEGDGSGVKKDAEEEKEPPVEKQEPDQPAALLGSLSIQQLQEMIANTIKAQYEGSSYTSMLYSKPCSKTVNTLRMPRDYQPPKFMQFDGKGNPKQHDKRLSITHHGKKESITDFKMFTPKVDKTGKEPAKEAPTISTTPVKASYAPVNTSSKNKVKEMKKDEPFRTQDRNRNTLKELEQKTYPFPDSDMAAMLDDLLEKKVIELPECKRPREMHRVNDPKYCKYHRIVGHPVDKCFTLKTLIMELAQQGRIELNLEDATAVHTATIMFGSFGPVPLQMIHDHSRQSSSHKAPSAQPPLGASNQDAPTNDEEGWTLVTHKEKRKPRPQAARHTATIMFGSFKSVPLQMTHDHSCQSSSHKAPSAQPPLGASDQDAPTNEEEGWTSVTCKRTRKPRPQAVKSKAEQVRKHHRINKRKSKRSAKAAKPTYSGELMEQKPRIPVSLHEYFPENFFNHSVKAPCYEDCEDRLPYTA